MGVFLDIAQQVLVDIGHPMSARDIYNHALNKKIIESKGLTPENTLRARLSENIRIYGENSIFIRTAANKFALRKWVENEGNIKEYFAPRFEKNTCDEYVVCLNQKLIDKVGRFFGFKSEYHEYLELLSISENLTIQKRSEANENIGLKQLIVYVLLKGKNGDYLSYERGNYSNKNQLLKDVLCLGFGGHVNNHDYNNLFGINNGGIWNAAYREVAEEIKNLYLDKIVPIGVINDDSSYLGLTHFAFVFEASLSNDFAIEKYNTELSINKLRFLSKRDLQSNYHKLEFWSQILAKKINPNVDKFVKIISRNKSIRYPIAVVGGIGTGKSEVAKILARNLCDNKIRYVSTREVVAELISENNFHNQDREDFQNKSYAFINAPEGTTLLANKIAEKIGDLEGKVIIDGIRQIDTFEKLKKIYPKIMLIYIETSRDKAYYFFKDRSKREASIHEFRQSVSHDVEKEISLFKHRADVYIFNGENIILLTNKIIKWLNEK